MDFGAVRIHTGQPAAEMNSRLGAQAFTHGRDIYFGAGKYSSGSPSARRLLAHELTHVVQQTGACTASLTSPRENNERVSAMETAVRSHIEKDTPDL